MVRDTGIRRDSKPKSHQLFADEDAKAKMEARNGLLQFDEVVRQIGEAERAKSFRLRPSTIQGLHRIAIQDIYTCAGTYRTFPVEIRGTEHVPPQADEIPRLVEECCDYVGDNWGRSAVHLSAFLMWKINWVHPFAGGNGRTSRAVSYLVLCAKLGYRLPGTLTIPEQVVSNREPYYAALDAADGAWSKGMVDVSLMEGLLSALLARQLSDVHKMAIADGP